MSEIELFAYALGAIAIPYIFGIAAMAYLSLEWDIPVFGAPPRRVPSPPSTIDKET